MDPAFLDFPDAPRPPPTAAYSHAVRAGDWLSFARTSSDSFISTEIRQSVHRPQDAGLG
jgi:hypothetical protein